MKSGFRIIDSDLHVIEPPNLYQDYIEPKFRDQAPQWTGHREHGNGGWVCQDKVHADREWMRQDTLSRELLASRKQAFYTSGERAGLHRRADPESHGSRGHRYRHLVPHHPLLFDVPLCCALLVAAHYRLLHHAR